MQAKTALRAWKLLALVVITAGCTLTQRAETVVADAGSNSQVFALLCELVSAATAPAPETASLDLTQQTKQAASLIKLFIADSKVVTELSEASNKDSIIGQANSAAAKLCSGATKQQYIDAAEYLKEVKKGKDAELVAKLAEPTPLRPRINATAIQLSELIKDSQAKAACSGGSSYAELMKKGLLGDKQDGTAFRLHKGGADRKAVCGQSATTAGTTAGKSIADDMLCICGSDSDSSGNKACDESSGAAVTYESENSDHGTEWQRLKNLCQQSRPATVKPTSSYLKNLIMQVKLHVAAGLEAKKAERDIRYQEIKLLNNSLTDLLHLNSHTADTKQATGTNGAVGTHANQVPATEQQCEAAKDNKDECGKLEKHGCVYNPQGDSGKKCTLKPEVKAQLEKANQETEGKDGENESKCGEAKTEDDCKKVPGKTPEGKKAVCGWIEGKCQDSSILVNKQFALSMVSAAFAALLF